MNNKITKILLLICGLLLVITPVYADGEETDNNPEENLENPLPDNPGEVGDTPKEVVQITNIGLLYERDYIVLETNNQMQLELSITPTDAYTDDLEWYSQDETIATIDQNGLITAHNYGETTIGIRNDYTGQSFTLRVISEPEKTLQNFVKKYTRFCIPGYYSMRFANDSQFIDELISVTYPEQITDPRISYTYQYAYTHSGSVYYNVTFSIENVDGTPYTKTVSPGLYFRIADNIDEDDKVPLDDELIVSFTNTLKYDLGATLVDSYKRITGKDTIIFGVEDISDNIHKKYRLDLLNGYTYNYSMVYYERKTITIETTNEITVPYNTRSDYSLSNYLRTYNYYGNISYNEELTNNYNFTTDHMGIYDFTTSHGLVPVVIYREEIELTDITINTPTTTIPLDEYNYELDISYDFMPSEAYYEIINWKSLNPDVATVDSTGLIKPVSLGTATITACNEAETVCGEIAIEVVPNSEIYLVKISQHYFYLFNDGLLYFLKDKRLEYINNNVKELYYDHYVTNDNKLYYLTYSTQNGEVVGLGYNYPVAYNIKGYYGNAVINTDDELYEYNYTNHAIGNKIIDNAKQYLDGLILTNDNQLYVYGTNHYGIGVNNGETIETPLLLASNVTKIVKDNIQGFYLTTDGILYVFNKNLEAPEVFDTNVTELIETDDNAGGLNAYRYKYKKGATYIYGSYVVSDSHEVIKNTKEAPNATLVEYNTVYGYNATNTYNIIDENGRFCTPYNCFDNVKDLAILDKADAKIIYLITNDDKLYYISTDQYDTFYYMSDNITGFISNTVIKTNNNNYWRMFDYGLYPYQLYRSSNPYISSYSIVFSKTNETDINIGDEITLDALVLPINVTNSIISWSVSDESLAIIDNTGKLTALKSGVVTVYAETIDGIINSTKVTIHPKPSQVSILDKEADYKLKVNATYEYNEEHNYLDITAILSPDDVIDGRVVWTSSNDELVTIENSYEVGSRYNYARVYENGIYSDEIITIYATLPDGSSSDSINIKLIKNLGYIDFENPTINLKYDDIYKIEPLYVYPEDFNLEYIDYSPADWNDYIDDDNYYHIRGEGTHTVNVYLFNYYYREFYIYAINEEESNNYLKNVFITDRFVEPFHSTIMEYDLGDTYDEVLNIQCEAYDEQSIITGPSTLNLEMGTQSFQISVYNENLIDPLRIYTFKIKRVSLPPTVNINDLTNALNTTTSNMVIVNSYDDDTNIISKEDIEIIKEKQLKLRINKYDRDLLLYSWDIDLTEYKDNTDFDSFVTLSLYDNKVTGISIDGYKVDFNFEGDIPQLTNLRIYANEEDLRYFNMYQYNNGYLISTGSVAAYDNYMNLYVSGSEMYLISEDYLKGDTNNNHRIDLHDIITLLKLYLGAIPQDQGIVIVCDIDNSGSITLSDIIKLLKIYLNGN